MSIYISDVIAEIRNKYNIKRIDAGQPPVDEVSRQVEIAVEIILTTIAKEMEDFIDEGGGRFTVCK